MDKDTLSEMAYIVMAITVAVMVVTAVTSPAFKEKTRELVDQSIPSHEQQEYYNDEVFREYLESVN